MNKVKIKVKVRVLFYILLLLSLGILLYFNMNKTAISDDYSNRVNSICLIFFITLLCLLYIIFEAYRIMYNEMTERVNIITANKNDLQTTYNSISMLLIEVNSDGIIINVNDSVCTYLSFGKNYIIGKKIPQVLQLENTAIQKLEKMICKAFTENIGVKEELKSKGSIFEASVSPLQDSSTTFKKVLLMLNDITQERSIYRQVLQDNKMVAIGQLAAGVAHEIRNPLGLIRTYTHLMKKRPEDEKIRKDAIHIIESAVDRSSKIIDNLLGFSRISSDRWNEIVVYNAINSVVKLEEHTLLSRNISVLIDCDSKLSLSTIVESLQIILINLIINAIDAIDRDGKIIIKCFKSGECLILSIEDTGTGIPEKFQAEIFNPFFTTKENNKGSGLGLYIVYNEIIKLEGEIKLQSSSEQGSHFIVTLPLSKGCDIYE